MNDSYIHEKHIEKQLNEICHGILKKKDFKNKWEAAFWKDAGKFYWEPRK